MSSWENRTSVNGKKVIVVLITKETGTTSRAKGYFWSSNKMYSRWKSKHEIWTGGAQLESSYYSSFKISHNYPTIGTIDNHCQPTSGMNLCWDTTCSMLAKSSAAGKISPTKTWKKEVTKMRTAAELQLHQFQYVHSHQWHEKYISKVVDSDSMTPHESLFESNDRNTLYTFQRLSQKDSVT